MKASKVLVVALATLAFTGCVSRDMAPQSGAAMAPDASGEPAPVAVTYLLEVHREAVDRMTASSAPHHEPPVACN